MRMLLQRSALGLAALCAGAWTFHAISTETGPVGWFNHAQQRLLGQYSLKMSAALMLALLMAAGGALFHAARNAGWLRADPGADRVLFGQAPGAVPPGAKNAGDDPRVLLAAMAVAIAAVWAAGLGWPAWRDWQQRQDLAARYEPMELLQGAQPARPPGSHLALRGRLLEEHVLTHATGAAATRRDDYHLVPIAAADWVAGQPVSFVLKVDSAHELQDLLEAQGRANDPLSAPPLRVRLDGEPPVPAVQAWARQGVPMASTRHLLRLVRTDGGSTTDPAISAFDRRFLVMLCGGLTVMILVALPLGWWRRQVLLRRAARARNT